MPVAAIYTSSGKDRYFHASMSCNKIGRVAHYRVNQPPFLINHEKYPKRPCGECWVKGGYEAEHDILAGRG